MPEIDATSPSASRGRGRGKSRGGLGKYLRARGRGRGGSGRPAEFVQRLVLEDEQGAELDEDDVKLMQAKYGARGLRSNADRYVEAEPDPDEDPEPEVDLSAFLDRQRDRAGAHDANELPIIGVDSPKNAISKINASDVRNAQDDGEVDHELEQMMISMQVGGNKKNGQISPLNRKDNKQTLEWDEEMETMLREKNAAEAMRDLKTRLQGNSKIKQTVSQSSTHVHVKGKQVVADTRVHPSAAQDQSGDAEAFLDDLLG